ncbi:hypothetical protein WEU32_11805 [Brevundimonas sp. BH3]|uniref:hypothetical protein n=1 Tax=Brevundimonas sp. BH3 TaxID=3133089 RepID=UPI00324A1AC8
MLSLTAALAGAIFLQSASENQSENIEAAAYEAIALTQQLFVVMGSCEAVLPPEAVTAIHEKLADQSDPQAAALLRTSYEAGKSSPKAATQTLETCSQDMQTVLVEIQALAAKLSLKTN